MAPRTQPTAAEATADPTPAATATVATSVAAPVITREMILAAITPDILRECLPKLRIMFRPAEWQSAKAGAGVRLAEATLYGGYPQLMDANGEIPLINDGIGVSMDGSRKVVVFLPPKGRVGSGNSITAAPRFIDDPEGGSKIAVASKHGEAAEKRLKDAIESAWKAAELTSAGAFNRLIDLSL